MYSIISDILFENGSSLSVEMDHQNNGSQFIQSPSEIPSILPPSWKLFTGTCRLRTLNIIILCLAAVGIVLFGLGLQNLHHGWLSPRGPRAFHQLSLSAG